MGWVWYVAAAALGGLVGFGELISRYRDAPGHLARYVPTWLYVGVNAGAAALALYLVDVFDWTFGLPSDADGVGLVATIVAGSSAMAVLRSSFATVRIRNVAVPVGPQAFLEAILTATDRQVDRTRAAERNREVGPIMADLSFEAAALALPAYCFQLLQNSTDEEEKAVGAAVRNLLDEALPDPVRLRLLGLQLMGAVGPEVLKEAVLELHEHLRADPPEQLGGRVGHLLELLSSLNINDPGDTGPGDTTDEPTS